MRLLKNGALNLGGNMRVLEYAKSLNANSEIMWWIENTGKAAIKNNKSDENDLEHIIDWMISGDAPSRLKKMSIDDAKRKTNEWVDRNIKNGSSIIETSNDIETFIDFSDGFKVVKLLTKNAFEKEGHLMSHCLGGLSPSSDFSIYSLRDSKNSPHCTIEVRGASEINQIKGKGNGSIHPKYINYVLDFLEKIGHKIRSNEMKNLGYYHIDKTHYNFIKSKGYEKEIAWVRDEMYAI